MQEKIRPKTIITAHVNADFDALASMVAAKKLYPGAELIAPSYRVKKGLNYLLDSLVYIFGFRQPKECDFSEVTTLVMTDTRHRSRVEHVAEVFGNPGLVIHCYDHHPDSDDDVPADFSVVKQYGSTTTIICDILMQKGVTLSPDEATMLGLGIYEDTGAFTFNSTTERDFIAAAWLKSQYMDLSVISDHINTSLTSDQVLILNRMIENTVTHEVHGISIMITEVVLDDYVDDFAVLTHQLQDMENVKVIFALGQMGDRVQVVARSQVPEKVDVSKICERLGGGGHSYAAAASVKDRTLEEVREELMAMLFSVINNEITVGSKMTSPAKVVEENSTLAEAEAVMLRYGLKACPVVVRGGMRCIGYLEYEIAAKAVNHKLGGQKVSDFMHSRVATVRPEDGLYPAMNIIMRQRQRLVPVVDAMENVLGVLTRTDMMNLLMDDNVRMPEGTPMSSSKERNVAALMKEKLPTEHFDLLRKIGELADRKNVAVYAVGGFVRDLIIDRVNLDIDVTVEGDGISFARSLAAMLGGRIRAHPKFQTAVVVYHNDEDQEQRLDVATARLEYYEHPGALPIVDASSINMDLSRRDFTINALAVKLNSNSFGELVDPFGAQRDIREKNIRVLHSLSFIEDPTRVLRAIRFEKRFGFKLATQTEKLIKNCLKLGFFQGLSGSRLFNELKHIFDEKSPLLCLERMDGLGILQLIHPILKLTPFKTEISAQTEEVLSWYNLLFLKETPENWVIYLMGLCANAKYGDVAEVLERLHLTEKARNEFMSLREATKAAAKNLLKWQKSGGENTGELYRLLIKIPLEGILHLMTLKTMQDLKKAFSVFLSRLWHMTLEINGDDLLALGAQPGPDVGLILKVVLEAKAGGMVKTREEQLDLAARIIREHADVRIPG